jgi:hypothetical protein
VLLFTTDAAQRFTADHSLMVHIVTVHVADAEDAFCASLRRAFGSSVRGPSCSEIDATTLPPPAAGPTPRPRRSTRSSPRPRGARSSREPSHAPPLAKIQRCLRRALCPFHRHVGPPCQPQVVIRRQGVTLSFLEEKKLTRLRALTEQSLTECHSSGIERCEN